MRWMWLANDATITRRPSCARISEPGCVRPPSLNATPRASPHWSSRPAKTNAGVVGQRTDTAQIGTATINGGQIQLEIARVQDHTLVGVEGGDVARRDRVGDRQEFAVERSDIHSVPVVDRTQLGVFLQPSLAELVVDHAEGERRPVDRHRQVREQIGQRADVVLVGVGGDARFHPVGIVEQIRKIRKDRIDPGEIVAAEHLAAVEDDDAPFGLDRRTVAADLAKAAEEGDGDRFGHEAGQLRPRPASTPFASISTHSGSGPIGGRVGPPGIPMRRNIALVGIGLGASPVSNA